MLSRYALAPISFGVALIACSASTLNAGSNETSTNSLDPTGTTTLYDVVIGQDNSGEAGDSCQDDGTCLGDLACRTVTKTSLRDACEPVGMFACPCASIVGSDDAGSGEPECPPCAAPTLCTHACNSDADCENLGVTYRCFENCDGGDNYCAQAKRKTREFSQVAKITASGITLRLTNVSNHGLDPVPFNELNVSVASVGLADVTLECTFDSDEPSVEPGSVLTCTAANTERVRGISTTTIRNDSETVWTSDAWSWK